MSYYDLINGYQEVFMKNNKYNKDISIELLYTFYLFDTKFQNILFRQSVFIENMFKTRLAQIIGKNLGVHQKNYLNEKHYYAYAKNNSKVNFKDLKYKIEKIYINNNNKYIPQPTKHYLETHNHIPPWILFKNVTFGNTINLYQLLKPNEKNEITNVMLSNTTIDYKQKVEFLTNSLNIIREYRNKIAHNLKFVTHTTQNTLSPKVTKELSPMFLYINKDIENKIGSNDIFAHILSIVILLDNPFLVVEFLKEIFNHISSINSDIVPGQNKTVNEVLYEKYSKITNLPLDLELRINKFIDTLR